MPRLASSLPASRLSQRSLALRAPPSRRQAGAGALEPDRLRPAAPASGSLQLQLAAAARDLQPRPGGAEARLAAHHGQVQLPFGLQRHVARESGLLQQAVPRSWLASSRSSQPSVRPPSRPRMQPALGPADSSQASSAGGPAGCPCAAPAGGSPGWQRGSAHRRLASAAGCRWRCWPTGRSLRRPPAARRSAARVLRRGLGRSGSSVACASSLASAFQSPLDAAPSSSDRPGRRGLRARSASRGTAAGRWRDRSAAAAAARGCRARFARLRQPVEPQRAAPAGRQTGLALQGGEALRSGLRRCMRRPW